MFSKESLDFCLEENEACGAAKTFCFFQWADSRLRRWRLSVMILTAVVWYADYLVSVAEV